MAYLSRPSRRHENSRTRRGLAGQSDRRQSAFSSASRLNRTYPAYRVERPDRFFSLPPPAAWSVQTVSSASRAFHSKRLCPRGQRQLPGSRDGGPAWKCRRHPHSYQQAVHDNPYIPSRHNLSHAVPFEACKHHKQRQYLSVFWLVC